MLLSSSTSKVCPSQRQQTSSRSAAAPRGRSSRTRALQSQSSATAPASNGGKTAVRIRHCRVDEADQVADLCGEAFGHGNFPGMQHDLFDALETRYATSIRAEAFEKLQGALEIKAEAAAEVHKYRQQVLATRLQAQAAEAQGQIVYYPKKHSPQERRTLLALNRRRMFAMLVAEAEVDTPEGPAGQRRVVGGVTLSIQKPEAVLPSPMPSNAADRVYLSNMCTSPAFRRRGIAKQLLAAAEKLGRRWGFDCVYLHVKSVNEAGQQLYRSAGYQLVTSPMDPVTAPLRLMQGTIMECLMVKRLGPPICLPGSLSDAAIAAAAPCPILPMSPTHDAGRGTYNWGPAPLQSTPVKDVTSSTK